jgi:hypothetical protein
MLLLVDQSRKLVAATVPRVVHRSRLFPSSVIVTQSLRNRKGHPVAMHAPPITQREVEIALPLGLQSRQQALLVSVARIKVGQQGHPAVKAALSVITVATARRLPSSAVTAPQIDPVRHRHHSKETMGQDLTPMAVLIVQSPVMNGIAVHHDLDNKLTDNGMAVVPKDRSVTSHHSPLGHKAAEIWTVVVLPYQPAGSIEMNVKGRRALP